ncbi:hypothetical protein DXG01_013891 [Tephrocybe rancida]|nr:hypothetical protein DXG01_013891 [Tephrocybe rancida]
MLPQEILANIVNLIDHQPTLRSCSTVSSSFRDIAQKPLFREIYIGIPGRSGTFAKSALGETLAASPRLCRFVTSIKIVVDALRPGDCDFPTLPLLHEANLLALDKPKPWKSLPPHFEVAFRKLLSVPTLRRLTICGVTDIPHHIACPACPLFLHIYDGTFNGSLHEGCANCARDAEIPTRVDRLFVGGAIQRADLVDSSSPLCVTGVRHLEVQIRNTESLRVCEKLAGPSLETLKISFMNTVSGTMHLSALRNLRRISFWGHEVTEGAPIDLLHNLKSLPKFNHLQEIAFSVRESGFPRGAPRWRNLDDLLTTEERFEQFNRVEFIVIPKNGELRHGIIDAFFHQTMPNLYNKGQLLVEGYNEDRRLERVTPR